MKNLRILLTFAALLLICMVTAVAGKEDSNRRKARYYYLEGVRLEADDNIKDAYELYRKAYRTDPTYAEAANAYGVKRMLVELDTLQSPEELKRSLSMARQLIDAYPDDYYEAEFYAYVAQALDTVEEAIRVMHIIDSVAPDRTGVLIGLAKCYMSVQDFDKAIMMLDEYIAREGESMEADMTKMTLKLHNLDTVGAVADATRLMEQHPGESQYALIKGQLFQAINRPDSALIMFTLAERYDSLSAVPKLALADLYREIGDSVNYDLMTYKALLTDDLEVGEKTDILAAYLQTLIENKQDTVRGDHLFSVLSEMYPHQSEVLDLAARYNAAKGNYAAAIENINYALDQDRNNISYWGQLMTYQLQADKPVEAMKTYRNAAGHIQPDNGIRVLYATAAQMHKDYDTVVNVYTSMINEILPPSYGEVCLADSLDMSGLSELEYEDIVMLSNFYTSGGDAYYQMRKRDEAFACYENALALIPNNALTLNNYAYFLCDTKENLDKAEEMSRMSLDIVPDNSTFLDTYAWILFLKQNYAEALKYQAAAVEKAVEEGSEGPDLYMHYGDILFMNGKPDEALANWEKALSINKDELSADDLKLLRKKVEHKTYFFK